MPALEVDAALTERSPSTGGVPAVYVVQGGASSPEPGSELSNLLQGFSDLLESAGDAEDPQLYLQLSSKLKAINERLMLPDGATGWTKRGELTPADARAYCRCAKPILAAAFSICSGKIALGDTDGGLHIYEPMLAAIGAQASSRVQHAVPSVESNLHDVFRHLDLSVLALEFNPVKNQLAIGTADGYLKLQELREVNGMLVEGRLYYNKSGIDIRGLSFSPDGRRLAACDGNGRVKLFDIEALPGSLRKWLGEAFRSGSLVPYATIRLPDKASSIQFAPDGKSVAVLTDKGAGRIFPVDIRGDCDPAPLARFDMQKTSDPRRREPAPTIAYSRDGAYIAAGCDGVLEIRDVRNQHSIWSLDSVARVELGRISSLDFSPDDLLAVAAEDAVRIISFEEDAGAAAGPRLLKEVAMFRCESPREAAFSLDGKKLLVAAGSGEIFVL